MSASIEAAAAAIYARFPGADKCPWVEGGNSHKQDEARGYARVALATPPAVTDLSAEIMALEPGEDQSTQFLCGFFSARIEAARLASQPRVPEYPAVMLTRGPSEMCEVSLEIDGKWVSVLRDGGTIISHIVEELGVKKRIAAGLSQ